MNIVFTDGEDKRFNELCKELDSFLNNEVGSEKQEEQYNQFNSTSYIHDAVIIVDRDQPIACGAFKKYDDESAEIKRVFVKEGCRKLGLGTQIISLLQDKAEEKGYKRLVLETGKPLKAAQNMYLKFGFKIIPNYGQYKDMSESVCMEKILK